MKKSLLLLWIILSINPLYSQNRADSLLAIWNNINLPVDERLEAIKIIHEDKNGFHKPANNDTAYHHAQLAYDLAKANGLKYYMAEALINQGNYFLKKNNLTKAAPLYKEGRALAEEIGAKKTVAASSYNLGLCYLKQGDFSNGVPAFTIAAKNFKEIKNKRMLAYSLDKIGMMYAQQNDPRCAAITKESLHLREELILTDPQEKDKMAIAMMKHSIAYMENATREQSGDNDSEKTKKEERLSNSEKLIADSKSIDDLGLDPNSSLALLNEGGKALRKGEKTKAKNYFTKAIKGFKEEANNMATSNGFRNAGYAYLHKGDTTNSLLYYKEALHYSQNEKMFAQIGEDAHVLYEIHYALGNYKSSLEMFQLSVSMRDSVLNIKNAKAVIERNVKSDYESQKLIDDLENDKKVAIETQKKENQQRLSLAIGIGLVLISILAFFIYNRLKLTNKQKGIIEEQKKKVEQSEKYKEQFLANMSHEIRTPMHAISGMVKILERNELYPSQENFLHAMRVSSENLIVILNDVLDLSKIEAGKLDIESIPIKPVAVIENVMQILKFKAEEKSLQLTCEIDDEVPSVIMGDPTRLNQILINLLGNSIKFTEKGSVKLHLSEASGNLRFSITDTGIGIAPDKIYTIFGAFEQAKDSTSRNYGGTGLGLSITQQLTELQNGKIWVESEEGQGSTFYVELPLVAAAADAVGSELITEDYLNSMSEELAGIRILLVEDNAFNQMIAHDDLNYYIKDLKIDTVENGILAVEKFKTETYDLILMDVQMPEMNGFDATRKIRSLEKEKGVEKGVPIIAMTASLLKTEINQCFDSGMNNYVPKPYKAEELMGPIHEEWSK